MAAVQQPVEETVGEDHQVPAGVVTEPATAQLAVVGAVLTMLHQLVPVAQTTRQAMFAAQTTRQAMFAAQTTRRAVFVAQTTRRGVFVAPTTYNALGGHFWQRLPGIFKVQVNNDKRPKRWQGDFLILSA